MNKNNTGAQGSSEINVYDCPENPDIDYKVAVYRAWLEGRPVQYLFNSRWARTVSPAWIWSDYSYRIDPSAAPKIAEGHNPDGLTEDQVGVKDGWRLLTKEEHDANIRGGCVYPVELWDDGRWLAEDPRWYTGEEPLRTKQPAGYFLPKEVLRLISEDGGKTWRQE